MLPNPQLDGVDREAGVGLHGSVHLVGHCGAVHDIADSAGVR